MKVYGIIPSRFGSSRFPGKPLAILAGKPLVAWVVEAVKKAKGLDEVLVATDDERIVKAVEEYGGKAVMTPSELPSGTDRIACAARNFLGADFADDDILVNIQGDEPLIDPALVEQLAAKLKDDLRWSMATAVTPIKNASDFAAQDVTAAYPRKRLVIRIPTVSRARSLNSPSPDVCDARIEDHIGYHLAGSAKDNGKPYVAHILRHRDFS